MAEAAQFGVPTRGGRATGGQFGSPTIPCPVVPIIPHVVGTGSVSPMSIPVIRRKPVPKWRTGAPMITQAQMVWDVTDSLRIIRAWGQPEVVGGGIVIRLPATVIND